MCFTCNHCPAREHKFGKSGTTCFGSWRVEVAAHSVGRRLMRNGKVISRKILVRCVLDRLQCQWCTYFVVWQKGCESAQHIYIHLRISNRRQYTFHCLCVHPSYQNSKTAACRFFNGHHLGINLLPHTMSFVMTAVDLVFHRSPTEAVLWQWMCQLVHIVFDGDPINANRFHLGKPLSRSSQCIGYWNLYIGQLASFHMPQCDPWKPSLWLFERSIDTYPHGG